MGASDKTKDAKVIEELELAWSAKMSRFYEDLASGKATYNDLDKYFTLEEIQFLLKEGILERLQHDEETNTYRITYTSESANKTYFIEMSSEGKAKIKGQTSTEEYKVGKYGNNNDGNADYYYIGEQTETINETISETIGYTTYYADINNDGTVDGIIYADLAVGNTGDGQWRNNDGNYTIPTQTNLKKYYISQKNYTDDFGTKDVIVPVSGSSGNDRFYIMALDDFEYTYGYRAGSKFCWFCSMYTDISYPEKYIKNDFGMGKSKTQMTMEAWNNIPDSYKNSHGDYYDLWWVIRDEVPKGWFVPSREEWAAFGGEIAEKLGGITSDNRSTYNLENLYWTSTQVWEGRAYCSGFAFGWLDYIDERTGHNVRLSTTF